jgi:CheY-like chemotaxis protein
MPEMDGLEATRRIKTTCPQIRIIMLSAYNNYRAEASAAGADDFLPKGCPIEALWAAILGDPHPDKTLEC